MAAPASDVVATLLHLNDMVTATALTPAVLSGLTEHSSSTFVVRTPAALVVGVFADRASEGLALWAGSAIGLIDIGGRDESGASRHAAVGLVANTILSFLGAEALPHLRCKQLLNLLKRDWLLAAMRRKVALIVYRVVEDCPDARAAVLVLARSTNGFSLQDLLSARSTFLSENDRFKSFEEDTELALDGENSRHCRWFRTTVETVLKDIYFF